MMRRSAALFVSILAAIYTIDCHRSAATTSHGMTPSEDGLTPPTQNEPGGSRLDLLRKGRELVVEAARRLEFFNARDGAVFWPPDFRVASDPKLSRLAESTAAFFWVDQLEVILDGSLPTTDCFFDKLCGGECGTRLQHIRPELSGFPAGAKGGGVVLGDGIVATNKHFVQNLRCAVDDLRVVFGFESSADDPLSPSKDLQIHAVERLCFPCGEPDLALVEVNTHRSLPPALPVELSPDAVDEALPVVAFGHPAGASRLMTGNDGNTYIQRCDDGKVYATLDSLKKSSGSPVYIPGQSGGEWVLFGLLHGNEENNFFFFNHKPDIDIVKAPYAPCQPHATGPEIIPLYLIEQDLSVFSSGTIPEGWICYPRRPSDGDAVCPGNAPIPSIDEDCASFTVSKSEILTCDG